MTMTKDIYITMAIVAVLAAWCLPALAYAENNYVLLIQSSPADAGMVTPGLGIHDIQVGRTIGLTATPKSGYRFAYWLGDVSAVGFSDTTISIDSPKMVVAVFVRDEFEDGFPGSAAGIVDGQAFSGGGVGRIVNPVQSPGSVSAARNFSAPSFNALDTDVINDEVPVPGEDDIPVPGEVDENSKVPEPATIMLLGFGGFLLRKRK